MVFKIRKGKQENKEIIVSGYLKAKTKEEQIILNTIVEESKNIKFYNSKFTTDEKNVLFNNISYAEVKKLLNYMSNKLDFKVKYEFVEDYKGIQFEV